MELLLKIVTPTGTFGPFETDSIHLTVSEDLSEKGGGSYGIRPGHAKALLSIAEGKIEAFMKEKVLLCGQTGSGFATVEGNTVTVVVETYRG